MKKLALIAALTLASIALPLSAVAQTATPAPAPKPTVKDRAKAVTQKVAPKRLIKRVEENQPIAEDVAETPLQPDQLAIAEKVITGVIKCELGASVKIDADEKKPGYFTLMHGTQRFRLHPVASRTGAVRLEDPRAEAMWLQLGNKSMLMSQKLGLRLADECQAAAQAEFAENMKKDPPKSLFEGADPQPGTTQAAAPAAAPAPAKPAPKK
ncbi:MAG: hypothetical protein ABWZ88_18570 [Variovorax sp.]